MTPPPINIDGSDITGATIDGTDVQEVTVDGEAVFSAIPDSGDLQANWDWQQASGTTTVPDLTGNNLDLTGSYTGPTATINGNQAGEFDGIDDAVSNDFANAEQPNTLFIVLELRSTQTSAGLSIFDGEADTGRHNLQDSSGDWMYFAGNNTVTDGANDTDPHIISALFDGADSVLRVDGTQVATGNPGNNSLDGIRVGADAFGINNKDVNIGQLLFYPQDKSGIFSDVESSLDNEWGPILP